MKNLVTMCSVFAATAGTALASVAPVQYTGPIFGTGNEGLNGDPSGNPFFVAPGIGSAAEGFFLSGAGAFADTSAGAMGDNIGGNIDGISNVYVDSVVTDNGGGNFDISIFLFTDGADLAPAGFAGPDGGALDTLGFFMGANAGGTNLDFSDTAFVNSASIEVFNAAGPAGGPFDISSFADFTADAGGWDGSLGVTFGAGSAGAGITGIQLLVNVDVVPAPSSMALLGFGGLVAARRRR